MDNVSTFILGEGVDIYCKFILSPMFHKYVLIFVLLKSYCLILTLIIYYFMFQLGKAVLELESDPDNNKLRQFGTKTFSPFILLMSATVGMTWFGLSIEPITVSKPSRCLIDINMNS